MFQQEVDRLYDQSDSFGEDGFYGTTPRGGEQSQASVAIVWVKDDRLMNQSDGNRNGEEGIEGYLEVGRTE